MGTNDGGKVMIPYETREKANEARKVLHELNEIWHEVYEEVEHSQLSSTYEHLKTKIKDCNLECLAFQMFDKGLELGNGINLVTLEFGKVSISN